MSLRSRILVCTAMAAVLAPAIGHAQAASTPAEPDVIGEVVVTAQKRAGLVQDIPIAISTADGETLQRAGVSNVTQINKLMPSVQIQDNGGGGANLYIRGVGAGVRNAFGDPANAFSLDGVYFSRPVGPSNVLFDVQRIEVLKGPQGTLYGRNATGGAFNVISNRPGHEFGGSVSAELGNYNLREFNGAVNLPVADKLALRAAFRSLRRDGYADDGYDDAKGDSFRISALFEPSDTVSLFLSADYATQGGMGSANVPVGIGDVRSGPSSPANVALVQSIVAAKNTASGLVNAPFGKLCTAVSTAQGVSPLCANPYGVPGVGKDGYVDNTVSGAMATLDVDLGFAAWTTIAGYRGTDADTRFYLGPVSQTAASKADQTSLESRLASKGKGPLEWLVGGFYLKEDQSYRGYIDSNDRALAGSCLSPVVAGTCTALVVAVQNSFSINWPDVSDETWALFGQATYAWTENLRVTLGVRRTNEDKSSLAGTVTTNLTTPGGATTSSYASVGSVSLKSTDYRAGLDYDVAKDSLLYANVSTGTHAGGLNSGTAGILPSTYEPEKLTAYALGSKNRFFDRKLLLNVEAFYWDYKDLQVQGLGLINTGPTTTTVALRTNNAGKAHIAGVEAEFEWRVVRGGSLGGTVLWTDSEYEQFDVPGITGATSAAGLRVLGVPEWTVNLAYEQRWDVAGGQLIGAVRTKFQGDAWMYYTREPANFQEAYALTDLDLTWRSPRGWSVTGYVRNIEDKDVLLQGYAPSQETGLVWAPYQPPRTYGVILRAQF
ncbi:TonB-dependent receptor [Caulobacter hibisci]|uniref:TonB-dependent receptor n=1 Tax=Caulobacter hibisci TaxID=2035993 RepID=A0ABS0SWS3_9CAUL|nr:TonB-dependent receptor [Caulobacter hibisci]MBI1684085.1 TonB-dependent receptor [Caulobacter hibisci]